MRYKMAGFNSPIRAAIRTISLHLLKRWERPGGLLSLANGFHDARPIY
jgi:hypothetical protein